MGSGLRAAAALGGRAVPVQLYTNVSSARAAYLRSASKIYGFESCPKLHEDEIEFEYRHSLAEPAWSSLSEVKPARLEVQEANILAFGMMEGNPIIKGDRVVYDPQSPGDPRPFQENGSHANQLAIVCNAREARLLSGERSPSLAARALVERHGAEVAIVKMGAAGALVVTGTSAEQIPAFRAKVSSLIGSGDLFSAVFAYHWAVLRKGPAEAALIASQSAAYFCATEILPVPLNLPVDFVMEAITPSGKLKSVYLAGPFFTPPELQAIEETRTHLESHGLRVFSPFHAIGLGPDEVVAEADLQGLRECDFVFAHVDGLDAGTLFELGYARALQKPVIVVATAVAARHLTMLRGSGCLVFESYVSAIYHAAWIR